MSLSDHVACGDCSLSIRCKICCIFRFRERYEQPILRGNDKKASQRDKHVGSVVAKVMIVPSYLREDY